MYTMGGLCYRSLCSPQVPILGTLIKFLFKKLPQLHSHSIPFVWGLPTQAHSTH